MGGLEDHFRPRWGIPKQWLEQHQAKPFPPSSSERPLWLLLTASTPDCYCSSPQCSNEQMMLIN